MEEIAFNLFDLGLKNAGPVRLFDENAFDADGKAQYETTELQIKGRHDVCLCPRIVPVVEAMTALVLADFILCDSTLREANVR